MKRYILSFMLDNPIEGVHIHEAADGEWVKFEDVEGIEKIGFGRVHCALCDANLSKGNHLASCELSGCNCEEMYNEHHLDGAFEWNCPAHGYKRL